MLSHGFDLHLSGDAWCSPSFLMRFVVFNICFIEMSSLILCPYLSLYCWVCKSSLYILDASPLSGIWFIIFSHSVGCLFTFLMAPFDAHKFLQKVWWSPICLFLSSAACALTSYLRNHFITLGHKNSPLCFLLRFYRF